MSFHFSIIGILFVGFLDNTRALTILSAICSKFYCMLILRMSQLIMVTIEFYFIVIIEVYLCYLMSKYTCQLN